MLKFGLNFKVQTKSFDDDFDSEPEEEIPTPVVKKGSAPANVGKEEDEDDSDFEDPDLIEVPGGGSTLQNLKGRKPGDAGPSMPGMGGKLYKRFKIIQDLLQRFHYLQDPVETKSQLETMICKS